MEAHLEIFRTNKEVVCITCDTQAYSLNQSRLKLHHSTSIFILSHNIFIIGINNATVLRKPLYL